MRTLSIVLLPSIGLTLIVHKDGGLLVAAYIVTQRTIWIGKEVLFTPDECRVEWEEYKKTTNIYEGDL